MQGDRRIDETLAHKAVREALINSLVHADYTCPDAVKIIKKPNRIEFTNPGYLRISRTDAFRTKRSDCRNRNLQEMFRHIGLVEQSGFGLITIKRAWEDQHWKEPLLTDSISPSYTKLILPTESLIDTESIKELEELIGVDSFSSLVPFQRWIMVSALEAEQINHATIKEIRPDISTYEISDVLADLVKQGFLLKTGRSRGASYYLACKPKPEINSNNLNDEDLQTMKEEVTSSLSEDERHLYHKVLGQSRSDVGDIEKLITCFCEEEYRSVEELIYLLNRSKRSVVDYIYRLVSSGKLERLYPVQKHPNQKYRKVKSTT